MDLFKLHLDSYKDDETLMWILFMCYGVLKCFCLLIRKMTYYSMIEGYRVSDYKEQPHTYGEERN